MMLAENFDQLDWATIASYVELKQEEHLHLDFKTLRNAELTSGDDKRNIARCISGFANSNGGIIIWGIDARKNSDDIDCASAIIELQNCSPRFPSEHSKRRCYISHHRWSSTQTDYQFKKRWRSGRHFCTGNRWWAVHGDAREQRYYKRSGDSFYRMEHFDLEDMFGGGRNQILKLSFSRQRSKMEWRTTVS